ncbi:hypothetical protein B566_EDAN011285, partial [Ephemera danica]
MPASDGPAAGFASPVVTHYLSEHEMLSAPSPTRLSESGLLRRRFKGHRSSKKSVHAYSDYGEADTDGAECTQHGNSSLSAVSAAAAAAAAALGPRSISLTALHPATSNRSGRISAGSGPLLEPRMAQLETLEAKMASIEVSLSSSSLGTAGPGLRRPKRTVASPVSVLSRVQGTPPSGLLVRSAASSPVPPAPSPPTPSNRDAAAAARELEALRNALRDKENVIQRIKDNLATVDSLRNQMGNCTNSWRQGMLQHHQPHVLSDKERRAAEERLSKLKQDMEAKRLAIKNLKMSLERLDITDVVSSAVPQKMQGVLLTVTLTLDPSNPTFGIARRSEQTSNGSNSAPMIEWAAQSCGLERGDRILEANGKLLLGFHPEELSSILGPNSSTLRLVILRVSHPHKTSHPPDTAALILKEAAALREELSAARGRLAEQSPESEKIKKERDSLKMENMRLSHRISYLEEQVSDLVKDSSLQSHHKSPAIKSNGATSPEIHVFQKGSHVTTIVTNLQETGRMPRRSDAALPPPTPTRSHRWHPGDESEGDGRSTRSLDVLHKQRPPPPKKPQRLSLPRAASLQQVDGVPLSEMPRKPSKRSHKGSNVVGDAVQKAETTLRWSNPAPSSCALPTNAQYQNHNQHLLNFRRS